MWVGEETPLSRSRGGRGGGGYGTHCLWKSPSGSTVLQISGTGPVGVIQRLASGNAELVDIVT